MDFTGYYGDLQKHVIFALQALAGVQLTAQSFASAAGMSRRRGRIVSLLKLIVLGMDLQCHQHCQSHYAGQEIIYMIHWIQMQKQQQRKVTLVFFVVRMGQTYKMPVATHSWSCSRRKNGRFV